MAKIATKVIFPRAEDVHDVLPVTLATGWVWSRRGSGFLDEDDARTMLKNPQLVRPGRVATLEEVTACYVHSEAFREELSIFGMPAWVNRTGLASHGPQEIGAELEFLPISLARHCSLPSEKRAYHIPGEGPVFVRVDGLSGLKKTLTVGADTRVFEYSGAGIAIVPDYSNVMLIEFRPTEVDGPVTISPNRIQNAVDTATALSRLRRTDDSGK